MSVIPDGSSPFFILRPHDNPKVVVVQGEKATYDKLKDIPQGFNSHNDACTILYDGFTLSVDTVSMLPFAQIRERGFKVNRDKGEDILTIKASSAISYEFDDFMAELAKVVVPVEIEGDIKFDTDEATYAKRVRTILEKEIHGGEGSSFVTPRKASAKLKDFSIKTALSVFNRLLVNEYGTYWTFIFYDGGENLFIGASPERHLLVKGELVLMNPISGTFRKEAGASLADMRQKVESFLLDPKERDELWMVTDEELKMMCSICPAGGEVMGPRLLDMSQLCHTEFELAGQREFDDDGFAKQTMVDCLRNSMFAPTVTGSPMGNACSRLFEYERKSRGYYSSACVLMGTRGDVPQEGSFRDFLDSCITIRTQEYKMSTGEVSIRAGATLVKDSDPDAEVKEVTWKLKAALLSLAKSEAAAAVRPPMLWTEAYPNGFNRQRLMMLLSSRNKGASQFWMQKGGDSYAAEGNSTLVLDDPNTARGRALVMNNDDDFAIMIAYMLRRLGIETTLVDYSNFYEAAWGGNASYYDMFVVGPGPGNPNDTNSMKMRKIRKMVDKLLQQQSNRVLAICLGHQMVGCEAKLTVMKKSTPKQGEQRDLVLFDPGVKEKLGFYNSFMVRVENANKVPEDATPEQLAGMAWAPDLEATKKKYAKKLGVEDHNEVEISFNQADGEIYGVRVRGRFVSFQFHPESILSVSGTKVLRDAVDALLERRRKQKGAWWACC